MVVSADGDQVAHVLHKAPQRHSCGRARQHRRRRAQGPRCARTPPRTNRCALELVILREAEDLFCWRRPYLLFEASIPLRIKSSPARKSSRSSCIRNCPAMLRVKGNCSKSSADHCSAIPGQHIAADQPVRLSELAVLAHSVRRRRRCNAAARTPPPTASSSAHPTHESAVRAVPSAEPSASCRASNAERKSPTDVHPACRTGATPARESLPLELCPPPGVSVAAASVASQAGSNQIVLVRNVPIDSSRARSQLLRQRTKRKPFLAARIEQLNRRFDDALPRERILPPLRALRFLRHASILT